MSKKKKKKCKQILRYLLFIIIYQHSSYNDIVNNKNILSIYFRFGGR